MAKRINQLAEILQTQILDNSVFAIDSNTGGTTNKVTVASLREYMKTGADRAPYIYKTFWTDVSWYRVWSDGWCELGGIYGDIRSGGALIEILPHTVLYANVRSTYGSYGDDNDYGAGCAHVKAGDKNYLKIYINYRKPIDLGAVKQGIFWEVKGIVDLSKFS